MTMLKLLVGLITAIAVGVGVFTLTESLTLVALSSTLLGAAWNFIWEL